MIAFHTIYIMANNNWNYENKSRFGYIYGTHRDLINILNSKYHSQPCYYIKIWLLEKTSLFKLKDIDKLLTMLARNIWKIHIVEDIYTIKLPLLKTLNKYLVKDKLFSEFIYNDGIPILEKIITLEFYKLGLYLIKTYYYNQILEINYMSNKLFRNKQLRIQRNYFSEINNLSTKINKLSGNKI